MNFPTLAPQSSGQSVEAHGGPSTPTAPTIATDRIQPGSVDAAIASFSPGAVAANFASALAAVRVGKP